MQDLGEFKAAVKAQYDIILVLVNALLALTILIAMIGIVNTLCCRSSSAPARSA